MKNAFLLLAYLSITILFSCSETVVGPEGPRGLQGNDGPQGIPGEGGSYVFEFESINFTAGNDYRVILPYENFDGLTSDVSLVYFLWGESEETGAEIWRLLPQMVLFDDGGILNYNFDFTAGDASVFLQANFPLAELGAIDTDNWVARVVVIPGKFWESNRVDMSDYYAVTEMMGVQNPIKDRTGYPKRTF